MGILETALTLNPALYIVIAEELERKVDAIESHMPPRQGRVFQPVEIAGEPLSETIIRERGNN